MDPTGIANRHREDRHGLTMVFGGGGAPGVAYLVGALQALEEAGIRPRNADHLVGTSAGSLVAAGLRLGMTYEQIAQLNGAEATNVDAVPREKVFERAWTSPTGLARRAIGVSWTLARVATRVPLPQPPRAVQRMFPGALFAIADTSWAITKFGSAWPTRPLWLVTVDLDSGRRVVLRRPVRGHHTATLDRALVASCAVPGMYAPVRIGKRRLVDGGVNSVTNFDLAVRTGSKLAICIAPMALQRTRDGLRFRDLPRKHFNREIAREAISVRQAGSDVIVIRPTAEELALRDGNLFQSQNPAKITQAAYQATLRYLQTPLVQGILERYEASQVSAPDRSATATR